MKILNEEGKALPRNGKSSGRLLVRGPWIASSYFKGDSGSILDEDGLFDTGDVATIDPDGYMQITDRSKDVIKSGGEWISSIDLENSAMGHPAVAEAAVIGVAHSKWQERPLLIIVGKQGRTPAKNKYLSSSTKDRQMVDAGCRGIRRKPTAWRDRQVAESNPP